MAVQNIKQINIPNGDTCRLNDYRITFTSGGGKFLKQDGTWADIAPGVTYTLSKSGSTITLTGSDGSTSSVSDVGITATVSGTNLTLA